MGTAPRYSTAAWYWHGLQRINRPNFQRRERPGFRSRWSGHELADVDRFRYFLGNLRQSRRQRYWVHLVASAVRLSLASSLASSHRNLLLPW